jgi:predicted nuclease with TOPRIM domain
MTDTVQPSQLQDAWKQLLEQKDADLVRLQEELRRLHEENESLLTANRDSTNHFDALMADHKKLHEVNQELIEALKQTMSWIDNWSPEFTYDPDWSNHEDKAKAAIAKAEGSV